MENIIDLKITGVDPGRPSIMQKEPYLDIVFKLSHKAPKAWCDSLNSMFEKYKYTVKIDSDEGLHLVTWVRTMEDIAGHLNVLKAKIKECNEKYIEKAKQLAAAENDKGKNQSLAQGEQVRLNQIISTLNFD